MAEELISEIIDLTATGKQAADLMAQLELIQAKLAEINNMKIGLDGLSRTKDIKTSINEASASIDKLAKLTDIATATAKEYRRLQNDLINSSAKLTVSFNDEAKSVQFLKEQQRQRNAELKNQVKEELSVKGSIEQRRAALIRLQKEYDNLAPKERESSSGKRLQGVVKGLVDQLKSLEGSTGRFQRNVGNYQGSAKIIVDALEKANKKFQELSKSADASPAALQRAGAELNHLRKITESPQFLNVSAKFGDANAEVKFFTKSLIDMERNGLGQSEAANQLRKQLAQLTDEIADVRGEIKALSSDTRAFDQFAGAVNVVADTFQTAAGAAALFGASEEDVQEATKNLVAIQAVSNGAKGIANELTTKGTVANKAYAYVQELVATTTNASAAATTRLAAAFKLIGIGLLVAAVGYLVANFDKLKRLVSTVSEETQELNDINRQSIDTYAKEKTAIENVMAQLQSESISKKDKIKIIDQLKEQYPAYLDGIKNEGRLSDELASTLKDKLLPALLLKSKITAAENIQTKLQAEQLEERLTLEEKIAERRRQLNNNDINLTRNDPALKEMLQDLAEVNKGSSRLKNVTDILLQYQQELQKLGGDPTDKTDIDAAKKDAEDKKKAAEEAAKKAKEIAERERKARFDILQQRLRDEADAQQRLAEDESKTLETRLDALGKAAELEKQLITNQAEFEVQAEGVLATEKKAIRIKAGSEQIAIDQETSKKGFDLLKAALEEEERLIQESQAKQVDKLSEEFERRGNALDKALSEELLLLEQARNTGALTEKEYSEKRLKIESGYQIESLESQITYYEQYIALLKSFGEDVTEEEAKLAGIRLKLQEGLNNVQKPEKKKQTTGDREQIEEDMKFIRQQYEVLGREVAGLLGDIWLGFFDKQKNKIQEQMDMLDQRKQKEIEAIAASTASEEEKAAKIAIINARAQAQKEQLEQRQRQIDIQRARAEKAIAIANIIAETAKAVIHQFTTGDTYTAAGRAALVGAIGAVQIARVIATPIPKFKVGKTKENKYEGPAWVGDGGKSEMIKRKSGEIEITPNVPTLTYIGKDDLILPDADKAIDDLIASSFKPVRHGSTSKSENPNKELVQEMRSLKAVIKSKPTLKLTVDAKGMQAMHDFNNQQLKWMNEQINWNHH